MLVEGLSALRMLASSVRLLGAGSVLEVAYDHDGILAADRLQPAGHAAAC